MAQILIDQNLFDEARHVIEQLRARDGDDPRIAALGLRLEQISEPADPVPVDTLGEDDVTVAIEGEALRVAWEITEDGLAMAKRRVRYSGKNIIRLFAAVPGPRGVRTSTLDIEAGLFAARLDLPGLPRPAVYVAAVGFLANTGEFLPLSRTEPLAVVP